MFVVLEVGHAIIELRKEQAILPIHPAYAESQPWRQAIRVMGRSLVRLFIAPSENNLERALIAVDHAISRVQAATITVASKCPESMPATAGVTSRPRMPAENYEIMTPESIGLNQVQLKLTSRSGRAAVKHRMDEMGYKEND